MKTTLSEGANALRALGKELQTLVMEIIDGFFGLVIRILGV